jgi:hypothetical protein
VTAAGGVAPAEGSCAERQKFPRISEVQVSLWSHIAVSTLTAAFRAVCAGVVLTACVSGCAHDRAGQTRRGYYGPTESMADVVAAINANNERVPTLWARHTYEATVVDEKGKPHFVNGDGHLLFRQPYEILLRGSKDVLGTVFEVGSNDERFWLKLVPEADTMWWGNYRNLGKPCAKEIPIRPDLILEVLGVSRIETDFTRQPAPTMRFNNDQDAYMFVWNVQASGPSRWIAQKEVWYDRQTKHPRLVLLFDDDGRVVLRAYLTQHKPVQVPEGPNMQPPPVVATDYQLFFPETKTRMWFALDDVMLQRNSIPNDRSFAFPSDPGVANEIQIDADCTD